MALPISTQEPTELCLPNPGPSHPILLSFRGRTLTLPLYLTDGQCTTLCKHIIPRNISILLYNIIVISFTTNCCHRLTGHSVKTNKVHSKFTIHVHPLIMLTHSKTILRARCPLCVHRTNHLSWLKG